MSLFPKAQRILDYLRRYRADTSTNIARALDIPHASVRRGIQELIRAGHNVTYASASGIYTYTEDK